MTGTERMKQWQKIIKENRISAPKLKSMQVEVKKLAELIQKELNSLLSMS